MLIKHVITTTALAVATATSTGTALAAADTLRTVGAGTAVHDRSPDGGKAQASAAGIKWTADQLQALAGAYGAKNPGWRAPAASGVHVPADMTWTSENLGRLANAYAALNPGWTRPVGHQSR